MLVSKVFHNTLWRTIVSIPADNFAWNFTDIWPAIGI